MTSTDPRTMRADPRNVDDPERDDHLDEARPHGGHERDGQDDAGKGHEAIHHPHQDVVEAGVVAVGRTKKRPPTKERPTTQTPTVMERRAPWITRLHTSRPK